MICKAIKLSKSDKKEWEGLRKAIKNPPERVMQIVCSLSIAGEEPWP